MRRRAETGVSPALSDEINRLVEITAKRENLSVKVFNRTWADIAQALRTGAANPTIVQTLSNSPNTPARLIAAVLIGEAIPGVDKDGGILAELSMDRDEQVREGATRARERLRRLSEVSE